MNNAIIKVSEGPEVCVSEVGRQDYCRITSTWRIFRHAYRMIKSQTALTINHENDT